MKNQAAIGFLWDSGTELLREALVLEGPIPFQGVRTALCMLVIKNRCQDPLTEFAKCYMVLMLFKWSRSQEIGT